jgi:hypothetical protein
MVVTDVLSSAIELLVVVDERSVSDDAALEVV